jgi:hypothetical protein
MKLSNIRTFLLSAGQIKHCYWLTGVTDPGSVADPNPGSGIGCLFDPWIRDPGWEKVNIRIRDEQPGSYFFELRNHFFAFLGVKILKFFDEDPGSRIRDPDGDSSDPGSGMEKCRIRDPGCLSRIRNTGSRFLKYPLILKQCMKHRLQNYLSHF